MRIWFRNIFFRFLEIYLLEIIFFLVIRKYPKIFIKDFSENILLNLIYYFV